MIFLLDNFIAKKQSTTPLFLKNAFFGFLSKKTQTRRQTALSPIQDFIEIIKHLPGYILIKYRKIPKLNQNDKNFLICEENLLKSLIFKYNNSDMVFSELIWIMPWFVDIKDQIQYLEIDASFKAVKPYAFCIFHSILNNSSIPIALSISPHECQNLYELFFECCKKYELDDDLSNIPVLSDMGDCIIAFCKHHGLANFFCHRHIIQNFGPRSSFGIWAAKILKCKTYTKFLEIREDIIAELNSLISKNSPIIDHNLQLKIDHLKIMLINPYNEEEEEDYIKWAN